MKSSGFRRICPLCGSIFFLCRGCDRWHVYCSVACVLGARALSLQKAQAAYIRTPHGREANRRAQKKFRQKPKTVIDQSSAKPGNDLPLAPSQIIATKEQDYESKFSEQTSGGNGPLGQRINGTSGSRRLIHNPFCKSPEVFKASGTTADPKPLGWCRVCGNPIFRLRSHDSYPGDKYRR